MTSPTSPEDDDQGLQIAEFFRPLLAYRRAIWAGTIVAVAGAVIVGGVFYWTQSVRWTASIGFRPVFAGIEDGEYPNKTKFGPGDVTDPTVIDQVFDKNQIKDYCPQEEFRSGFVVTESSTELQFLDLEYQAKLSDTRISAVDRTRLQEEYRDRRRAAVVQFVLTFFKSRACAGIPPALVTKSLTEVLETWASDADRKRGALKVRVATITPAIFDFGDSADQSLLIRGDLIRSATTRVIANLDEVAKIPGAELIQVGESRTSLIEVRSKLEDLVQAHLDPLIAIAGRGLGREAVQWVEQVQQVAAMRYQTALQVADAYRNALQAYSAGSATPSTGPLSGGKPPVAGDTSASVLAPQLDSTFIDRIVDLQAANTTFRQGLTRKLIDASLLAAQHASAVEHYRQLIAALKAGVESSLSPAEVGRRFDALIVEGKRLTAQFDEIHEEFSRRSLRSGAAMYRLESPAQVEILRSFTLRDYLLLVVGILLIAPVILAIFFLARNRFRRFARGPAA